MPWSYERIALVRIHDLGQRTSVLGYDVAIIIVDVGITAWPVTDIDNLSPDLV